MIKIDSLRDKIPIMKKAVGKCEDIGKKKYSGNNYVVPKASLFNNKESLACQDEIFVSHRSLNRGSLSY